MPNLMKPNSLMSNLMNSIMPNLNVRTMISDKRWHHLQCVLYRNDRMIEFDIEIKEIVVNVENVKEITLCWMHINEDQEHVIKYVWSVWRSLFVIGKSSVFNYQDQQRTIIPNISDPHKKQKCIYEVLKSPHMHTANIKLWQIITDTITRDIASCVMLQFYTLRT